MTEVDRRHQGWFKSSYSGSQGDDCVEVTLRADAILVRDSKEGEDGRRIAVTGTAWTDFVTFAARA